MVVATRDEVMLLLYGRVGRGDRMTSGSESFLLDFTILNSAILCRRLRHRHSHPPACPYSYILPTPAYHSLLSSLLTPAVRLSSNHDLRLQSSPWRCWNVSFSIQFTSLPPSLPPYPPSLSSSSPPLPIFDPWPTTHDYDSRKRQRL